MFSSFLQPVVLSNSADEQKDEANHEEKPQPSAPTTYYSQLQKLGSGTLEILRGLEVKVPVSQFVGMLAELSVMVLAAPASAESPEFRLFMQTQASKMGSWASKNYSYYLTAPDNAISESSFDQDDFIRLVNMNYPELKFSSDGVCFGVMLAWYAGLKSDTGMNLISQLKLMQGMMLCGEKLHARHRALLEAINALQMNQNQLSHAQIVIQDLAYEIKCSELEKPSIVRDADLLLNLEKLVAHVIELALASPGILFDFAPIAKNEGHAIGLTVVKEKGETVIKYMDSNFREASFADAEAAKKSITRLLCFAYSRMLTTYSPEKKAHINQFQITTIQMQLLQLENSSAAEVDAAEQPDANQYFRQLRC